jgi:DNA-binding NarL/FixJ family response regulator
MSPIRVVLVDDHPMFREGVRFTLQRSSDIEVVGEAADGAAAITAVADTAPDVVLMDLAMPGIGGLEATTRIIHDHPDVAVLVLTMSEQDTALFAALRAGARGYLVKGAPGEEIISAVRSVAAGHVLIGAPVAARTLEVLTEPGPRGSADPEHDYGLTQREHEVLALLADGLTNHEIADRLVISPITARNHVSNILTKLQVRSRRDVIRRFGRYEGT